MNNFLKKVASTIEKFNMANKSERLLVCLSGGADSVTLLLCLYEPVSYTHLTLPTNSRV